jgi:hypothetical protein
MFTVVELKHSRILVWTIGITLPVLCIFFAHFAKNRDQWKCCSPKVKRNNLPRDCCCWRVVQTLDCVSLGHNIQPWDPWHLRDWIHIRLDGLMVDISNYTFHGLNIHQQETIDNQAMFIPGGGKGL